ncbi:Hypothetical protein PEIBARAKI_5975 [Petrimonas sp. IBARAKI]|nr:Hypothetical protein PEIBARAKI_5975 [Petrimonas sp. IBARAKI]
MGGAWKAFNRTIVELKFLKRGGIGDWAQTFNRTIVELKYGFDLSNLKSVLLLIVLS